MMKNTYLPIIFSFAIFSACDKIPEDQYRKAAVGNVEVCPTPSSFPVQAAYKKVLLEDFTGHTCGNCPDAAETAHTLKEKYGDSLVVMAIHYGSFAKARTSGDYTYDFQTSYGNQIGDYIAPSSFPKGSVNQKKFNGAAPLEYSAWGQSVAQELREPVQANIVLLNTYNADTKNVCIHSQINILENLNAKYRYAVYLIEDSVVKPQTWYAKSPSNVLDYVHMHVLRISANGGFGENLAGDTINFAKGKSIVKKHAITLKPDWLAKNCKIVAVLMRDDNKEVIQVEEKKLY